MLIAAGRLAEAREVWAKASVPMLIAAGRLTEAREGHLEKAKSPTVSTFPPLRLCRLVKSLKVELVEGLMEVFALTLVAPLGRTRDTI
jgi:hypothetical protein